MRRFAVGVMGGLFLLSFACATRFSPQAVREEIERQTGVQPQKALEITLGKVTMGLAKSLAAAATDGQLPLSGLDRIELAVYPVPAGRAGSLDFSQMEIRGWEPTVKVKGEQGSGFVLVRSESAETIGDLVVVAAGSDVVVYGRLRGRLPKGLPKALGEVVQGGGPSLLEQKLREVVKGE